MKILVIRACAVGDFVLNLPALRALQESHSGTRFTLVGYPGTLALARDFVNVEAIHSIELEPWSRLFREPIELSGFDRAIVWMKNAVVAENLIRSGLQNVLRAEPFPTTGHAATHLLDTLGLQAPDLPNLWRANTTRIILHPGSGSPKKCWPHFRELADRLGDVAFLIGPAELQFDSGAYPRLEGLSLREVSLLLRSSRAFVGNDSGITHLAAYVGCPTNALFGPTDPAMWGPIGRRIQILNWPTVAEVEDALETSVNDETL